MGIVPEGTELMLTKTHPRQVGKFYRGFAHLGHEEIMKLPQAATISRENEE